MTSQPTKAELREVMNERQATAANNCYRYAVTVREPGDKLSNIRTYRLPCKSWYCPACGPRKVNRLRHKLREWTTGDHWRLVTLTTRERGQSTAEGLRQIVEDWKYLAKRIKRRWGAFRYFRVVQFHKNGQAHLHILVNKYLPQRWIRTQWAELHDSPIVDVRRLKTKQGINYVTRYLSRSMDEDEAMNAMFYITHTRRYSTSLPGPNPRQCPNSRVVHGRHPLIHTVGLLMGTIHQESQRHGLYHWMLAMEGNMILLYPWDPLHLGNDYGKTDYIDLITTESHQWSGAFDSEKEIAEYLGIPHQT